MSFFDDDAEVTQVTAPTPRSRRKRNRSRLRIQRLVIALVALFVLVFVLALVIRSCQQNAKESTYRSYFTQVQQVESDATNKVGKPIAALLADPTKFGRTQLEDQLSTLVATQNEITTRTARINAPGKLKSLHQILVQGQQVRLAGVQQVRAGLLAALTGKGLHATARKLAALSGYFTGPDVYYNQLYRTQAQKIVTNDGVTNVAVPEVGYFAERLRVLADRPERGPRDRVVVGQAERRARRGPGRGGHQEQRRLRHPEGGLQHALHGLGRRARARHGAEPGHRRRGQRGGQGHLDGARGQHGRRPHRHHPLDRPRRQADGQRVRPQHPAPRPSPSRRPSRS